MPDGFGPAIKVQYETARPASQAQQGAIPQRHVQRGPHGDALTSGVFEFADEASASTLLRGRSLHKHLISPRACRANA